MSGRLASTAAVERFLQRTLSADQFRGMRAMEPCVVQSAEDGRGIKFVVVLEEAVFVCDNPPKKVVQLFWLRDVLDICLVHEVPEFLQAELGRKVTHVRVRLRREPRGSRSASPAASSPRASRSSLGAPPSPRLSIAPLSPLPETSGLRKVSSMTSLSAAATPQKRLSLAVSPLALSSSSPLPAIDDEDSLSGSFDGRDFGLSPDDGVHFYALLEQSHLSSVLEAARLDVAIRESLPPSIGIPLRLAEDQYSTFLRGILKDLAARRDIEARFELVDQLHSACTACVGLRRVFWRAREHYGVLADQLRQTLAPGADADTLEYAALVAEALAGLISVDAGRAVLAETSPRSPADLIAAVALVLAGSDLEPDLAVTVRRSAVALIYELLEHSAAAPDSPMPLPVLAATLVGSTAGRAMVTALVGDFLRQLDRPAMLLDGATAVSTFRLGRVCTRLVCSSNALADVLRTTFRDEFRYMVNLSSLRTELSGTLPVNAHMLACVALLRDTL